MQCRHSIWLGSVTCSRVSCSSRGSRGDAHRRCQQWHQADPRGKCLGLFGAIVRGTCVLYAATPVQRGIAVVTTVQATRVIFRSPAQLTDAFRPTEQA